MTTTELIKQLNAMAKIGIVNAKQDTKTLREAAHRLYELRAKADPDWDDWLIMDDGMFLQGIDGDETDWTPNKDDALAFASEEAAKKYIKGTAAWYAKPVLRGDFDAYGMVVYFDAKD